MIDGLTTPMLVKLGENGVKSLDDFADLATDDLVGWSERKEGETKRHAGYLDGFDISRQDAESMIMNARLKLGWIDSLPEAKPDEAAPDAE